MTWTTLQGKLLPLLSAWVLCIDGTPSVDPHEFNLMKEAVQSVVRQSVSAGDTVWLMRIGDEPSLSRAFRMPPRASRPIPAEQREAAERLRAAKQPLIDAIEAIASGADRHSDLVDSAERALATVTEQGGPGGNVVFATDGMVDQQGAGATVRVPNPPPALRADGVRVLVLFGYPNPSTLRGLRLTRADAYRNVAQQWQTYFTATGATVQVRQAVSLTGLGAGIPGAGH